MGAPWVGHPVDDGNPPGRVRRRATVTIRRPSSLWLRSRRPVPEAGSRLVCFPHAGGPAGYYLSLLAPLSPGVEVSAVQYPGRQDRLGERPVEDLHWLADLIAAELDGVADRPCAFFGHSYGAVVAYEVALRLAGSSGPGSGPAALYVSGSVAPSRPRPLASLPNGDAALLAELRELSGTESAVLEDPELMELLLPALRADYHARRGYLPRPGPVLDIPISALVGDGDPKVTVAEADAWREHTTAGFDLTVFPGGHFYLVEQQPDLLRLLAVRQASLVSTRQAG
ncbi:thioesterase II family protein [Streptacidiphilus sp. N1-12]|uniref:Thioesterase II family protein n=2 Tax=Streptacidiphilus alkalitolerans TaxID=3342712 RepID=A0ABV6WJ93_9ACTN